MSRLLSLLLKIAAVAAGVGLAALIVWLVNKRRARVVDDVVRGRHAQ